MKRIALVLSATVSIGCHAEYVRTGPMTATVCKGLVIKSCDPSVVKAIEKDGKFYEPAQKFASVDEHKNNKCHLTISSSNVITAAVSSFKTPTFYTEEDGKLAKISPDYVTFPCVQR